MGTLHPISNGDQYKPLVNLVELAAQICKTPTAMINLLDDHHQKTYVNVGWDNKKIPIEESICQITVGEKGIVHISDTSKDPRLKKIEAVENDSRIGFYAGISFQGLDGAAEGTLCVLDNKPRKLTRLQKKALETLASEIELRLELLSSQQKISEQNNQMKKTVRFLKNSADIKLILDPQSLTIREVHTDIYRKLGYTSQELTGERLTDYCNSGGFVPELSEWLRANNNERFSFETQFTRHSGEPLDMLFHVTIFEDALYVTGRDISKRKAAEKQRDKEKRLSSELIENLPGIFCLIDHDGKIHKWNRNLESVTEYSSEEMREANVEMLLTYDSLQVAFREINNVFRHHSARAEIMIVSKSGATIPFLISGFNHRVESNMYAVVIGVNISDEKRAESELLRSLEEKEIMLSEIHHRVKNNLAIVSGLLQLETDNTVDDNTYNTLMKSVSRIKSMAMIHEQLYTSSDFSNIPVRGYVNNLIGSIKDLYESKRKQIQVETDIDDIHLNINQAIPCALLLNELITNAYKHAFQEQSNGKIEIKMKKRGCDIVFRVQDNGKGIPENINPGEGSTLGFTLLEVLSAQLKGNYRFWNEHGACVEISFTQKRSAKGSSGNLYMMDDSN